MTAPTGSVRPSPPTQTKAAPAIPVHPERTTDPRTLRWPIGTPLHGTAGLVAATTEPLECLVADGVLSGFDLADGHIDTRIAKDRTWTVDLASVREAVRAAVAAAGRHLTGASQAEWDTLIGSVASTVAAELVTPLASSHGGAMEVTGVCDGVVSVRLHGACHGCPAATNTVQTVFGQELRRRLPDLDDVRVTTHDPERGTLLTRVRARVRAGASVTGT